MVLIDELNAKQILNSQGEPTLEVTVYLSDGTTSSASIASGGVKSPFENVELLDKDFSKYFGHSVHHAIKNVNDVISPRLKKLDPTEHFKVDQILNELDNTPNKAHLGANTMLAVSTAVARGASQIKKIALYKHLNELFVKVEAQNRYEERIHLPDEFEKPQLPIPAVNMIAGNQLGHTNLSVREFMILPVGLERMKDKIQAIAEIRHQLEKELVEKGKFPNYAEDGAFIAQFDSPQEPIEMLVDAVHATRYHIDNKILYGLDLAGADADNDLIKQLLTNYPIVSIEDPYQENDWGRFSDLNNKYPDLFVVGDNLTASNKKYIFKAIETDAVDALVIKPGQVGTITETLEIIKIAKDANLATYVSTRTDETNDNFIVDLAIGVGAKFIKIGGATRGERVTKLNRILDLAPDFEIPE